jgi:hypothetical protein
MTNNKLISLNLQENSIHFNGNVSLPNNTIIVGETNSIQSQIDAKVDKWMNAEISHGNLSLDGRYFGTVRCRYHSANLEQPMTIRSYKSLYLESGNGNNDNIILDKAFLVSDDRLKHNEKIITNALSVICKTSPQFYDKMPYKHDEKTDTWTGLDEVFDASKSRKEYGFIAQEILAIPELENAIGKPEDPNKEAYSVDYTQIFVWNVAAVKELNSIVESQKDEIKTLKDKLNELLIESGKEPI